MGRDCYTTDTCQGTATMTSWTLWTSGPLLGEPMSNCRHQSDASPA